MNAKDINKILQNGSKKNRVENSLVRNRKVFNIAIAIIFKISEEEGILDNEIDFPVILSIGTFDLGIDLYLKDIVRMFIEVPIVGNIVPNFVGVVLQGFRARTSVGNQEVLDLEMEDD